MGKKLTDKEKEDRLIESAIKRIESLEKKYGFEVTRFAASRYSTRRREELRLKKKIEKAEKELQDMKKRKRGK